MKLSKHNPLRTNRRIKKLVVFFMVSLILSGLTACPIESGLSLAVKGMGNVQWDGPMARWISLAYLGVSETNERFPFIAYGTDWLAFAHLVLAVAFIGPLRDPLRNVWVIEFGIIACVAVLPMAFIAGEIRGIPVFWRLIDCMFGVIGGLVLWRAHADIKRLEEINARV